MKFIEQPDNPKLGWSNYRVSEGGLVHIGVYPVIFGYRVRAGFTDDVWGVNLDWCGGSDWNHVTHLYRIALSVLGIRAEDRSCFDGLPGSTTKKPFYLDADFMVTTAKLLDEVPEIALCIVDLKRPPVRIQGEL